MTRSSETAHGRALCDYARSELEAGIAALGADGDDLHEGVHRARKAIRRARATLALGDRALGPGYVLLDRELKHLNRGLSRLRDAQALVEICDRLLDRRLDESTRTLLQQAREIALERRARIADEQRLLDPGLEQRRALLRTLTATLATLDWGRLTPSSLRMALADSEERMRRAQERAETHGQKDEEWHRWRRRARRVAQQRTALESADVETGPAGAAFDKRLAERLGLAQDLTLLLAHCGDDSPFSQEGRAQLRHFAEPALQRVRKRIARSARKQAT